MEDMDIKIWILPLFTAIYSLILFIIANYVIKLLKEDSTKLPKDMISSQKLIPTEVFGEPKFSIILCAVLGSGVQFLPMSIASIVSFIMKAGGFHASSYVTAIIFIYFLFPFIGMATGYFVVLLYKAMKGNNSKDRNWSFLCFLTTMFSVGGVFHFIILLKYEDISLSHHQAFLTWYWFAVTLPMMIQGGYLGEKSESNFIKSYIDETATVIRIREDYKVWAVSLIFGSVAGVILYGEICFGLCFMVPTEDMFSITIFSIFVAFLTAFAIMHSWCVISHLSFCSGKPRNCWWKIFYGWGVPFSLYAFLRIVITSAVNPELRRSVFSDDEMINLVVLNLIYITMLGAMGVLCTLASIRYSFFSLNVFGLLKELTKLKETKESNEEKKHKNSKMPEQSNGLICST